MAIKLGTLHQYIVWTACRTFPHTCSASRPYLAMFCFDNQLEAASEKRHMPQAVMLATRGSFRRLLSSRKVQTVSEAFT